MSNKTNIYDIIKKKKISSQKFNLIQNWNIKDQI